MCSNPPSTLYESATYGFAETSCPLRSPCLPNLVARWVEPSNQRSSIFDLVRVRDRCRTILGTVADIHDYDGLRRLPEFRRRVNGDLIRVF